MRNKSVMLVLGKHKTSATHALTSLSVVEKSAPRLDTLINRGLGYCPKFGQYFFCLLHCDGWGSVYGAGPWQAVAVRLGGLSWPRSA